MTRSGATHHLKVHAFLIVERLAGSKEFLVSVLLRADGQFIGKTSLGTVAEGQEILLSLRWDQPSQRFVASSRAGGGVPILSFIPCVSPMTTDATIPPDFSMSKDFLLNSAGSNNAQTQEARTEDRFVRRARQ